MEIRQLRHFIAAVEAGNLRKASEDVHISHPALSMSLKNLETSLGTKLLIKDRRGVQTTYAGELFLTAAHSILRRIDDIETSLLSTHESPVGNVKLGITYAANNALAAPLYKLLMEKFPGIRLQIEEGNTTILEREYDQNLIDIMFNYDISGKMDQKVTDLYTEHLYLITAYDPKLDTTDEIDSKQLDKLPIVCSPGTHSMRLTLEKYARDNDIEFNFDYDFQSAHASLKIVIEGLANTVAPWDLIHDHVKGKLVSARKIVNPMMERRVCLVSSLQEKHSPAVNAMIEAIKLAVKDAKNEDKIRGRNFLV
ncbi:MAG: LysR family transcriptional regulator [Acidiferrobacterales bacterium]|nr:LysR family transcriptional regulator [Acidiferrobacterales bacterium]